jgi:hypothetical protein
VCVMTARGSRKRVRPFRAVEKCLDVILSLSRSCTIFDCVY